ncbi:hypothetical protein H0H92_012687 [Tricholoma furcatifolium]|nr:hypothetical protein H0H92_012687 [Tricholoma furcatifolium]
MWRNSYGRLFKSTSVPGDHALMPAGPDALDATSDGNNVRSATPGDHGRLAFKFAPDMKDLINPDPSSLPAASDGWAMHHGWVSVTPLRASFGEPVTDNLSMDDRIWKLKL